MTTTDTISIAIEPYNDSQREFLASEDKVMAFIGGVGSGKTHIGAAKTIVKRLQYPNARMLVAANTYRQLESATLPGIFRLLEEWGIPYTYNKHDKDIKILMDGFEKGIIHCRSLENYDSLRGMELFYIWLDETRDTSMDAFNVCLTRLREKIIKRDIRLTFTDTENKVRRHEFKKGDKVPSFVPPEAITSEIVEDTQMAITTTPDMIKAKWLYDYLHNPDMKAELSAIGIEIKAVHCSSRDNPYLDEAYLATMTESFDEEFRKQEIEGQWIIIPPGKPVYANSFNIDIHTGKFKFVPDRELYIFWDFGFHRPSVHFAQEDSDDRLVVLGEILGQDISLENFCDDVWSYMAKHFTQRKDIVIQSFCDPAGNSTNEQTARTSVSIMRKKGFKNVRWKRLKIEPGIICVRQQLNKLIKGRPALLFNKDKCPITVEALRGGYHYPEKRKEFQEESETPYKDGYYEHLMDDLRYGITNLRYVLTGKPKYSNVKKSPWSVMDKTMGY